jgi:cation diffusion facilitator CzcD-associated flavoprotein CzcO
MHDVLVLGAGLSGIYNLYLHRKRLPSWKVKCIEAGGDVGGVWMWNRYPGCRIDTESVSYCFSFDKELLEHWEWNEQFATQADIRRYLQHVAHKHDLYKDIRFDTRIKSAHWNDAERYWTFVDEAEQEYKTRFFVSCLGFLSAPTLPDIPGIQDFAGESFHTSRWPAHLNLSCDFANKRIGVIGTGATGIQAITAISKEPLIKNLTVFQRTANWSAPLHNSAITPEQMAKHKGDYGNLFARCAETPTSFLHAADPRKSLEISEEERNALWEKLYSEPGFAKWLSVFSDTYTNREANKMYSDFMANKIRRRVHNPEVAESLIPKNHGFGTRRVPLESGYFEAYNRPNVHLVDLQKTPVDQVTANGIRTSDGTEHPLDILIFATGFDAITGAFNAIDWHAKDGRPLTSTEEDERACSAIWPQQRPRTFLGLVRISTGSMPLPCI